MNTIFDMAVGTLAGLVGVLVLKGHILFLPAFCLYVVMVIFLGEKTKEDASIKEME